MIPIKNIYYMLSYAFTVLQEKGYKNLETEEFENVADMCAAILEKGIALQLKRGLGKEYIPKTETLSGVKGKIDISESIKTMSILKQQLVCTYDDFSENSYFNQIIKSTVELLLKADISKQRKKSLKKQMVFFSEIDTVNLYTVNWQQRFNRNNKSYQLLISICYLIVKGLLQSQGSGNSKLMDFFDEQRMCRLYEKFILEYYRKHYPQIKTNASQIPWQLDGGGSDMLPVMQSDIMLQHRGQVLIIDAKYYSHTTQVQFGKHTLHSNNLYQIFTYVKNKEAQLKAEEHEVSGMLLYAKTDEEVVPNNEYRMSGNRIVVRTLDLGQNFELIRKQLDGIVERAFETRSI